MDGVALLNNEPPLFSKDEQWPQVPAPNCRELSRTCRRARYYEILRQVPMRLSRVGHGVAYECERNGRVCKTS